MLTNEEVIMFQQTMEYIEIIKQISVCLLICGAKILEISIQSVKTVCMVKGQKVVAAILGFIECLVWGLVVSSVITTLSDNFMLLFAYCLGYASGLYLGSIIENKIALGTSNLQVVLNKEHVTAAETYLKEHNYGYIMIEGRGAKEENCLLIAILPRKDVKLVTSEIQQLCNNKAFIVTSEVSKYTGGYGIRK